MRTASLVVIALTGLIACTAGSSNLSEASKSYRQRKDCASLKMIADSLRQDMPRKEVEELLGTTKDGPSDGVFVYFCDRMEYDEGAKREVPVALTVGFDDLKANVTDRLQYWDFGRIAE